MPYEVGSKPITEQQSGVEEDGVRDWIALRVLERRPDKSRTILRPIREDRTVGFRNKGLEQPRNQVLSVYHLLLGGRGVLGNTGSERLQDQ